MAAPFDPKQYSRTVTSSTHTVWLCSLVSAFLTYRGVSASKDVMTATAITLIGFVVQIRLWTFLFDNVPRGFSREGDWHLLKVVSFISAIAILGTTSWFSFMALCVPDAQRVHMTQVTDRMDRVVDDLQKQRFDELELRKAIKQGADETTRLAEAEGKGRGGLTGFRNKGPVHGALVAMQGAYKDALGILEQDAKRIETASLEAKDTLSDMRALILNSYELGDSRIGEVNRKFAAHLALLNDQLAVLQQSSVPTVLETVRGADTVAQHISMNSFSQRMTDVQERARESLLKIAKATRSRVEARAKRLDRRPVVFEPERTLMPLEAVYQYSLPYLTPWAILPLLTDLVVPGCLLVCLVLLANRRREEDDLVEVAPVESPVHRIAPAQVAAPAQAAPRATEASLTEGSHEDRLRTLLSNFREAGGTPPN